MSAAGGTIGFVAGHVLLLVALAATTYVAGRLLWRGSTRGRVDRRFSHSRVASVVLASTLGLAALGTVGCLLGLAGQLRLPWLLAAVGVIHLAGLGVWREPAASGAGAGSGEPRAGVVWSVALVASAPLLPLAIYPPTAFDETLYHLPFARAFARSGALPFLPELRFPIFPQLSEVLAAEVLLVAGDTATHLWQLLSVILTAALLWAWGREWGGGTGAGAAGLFAAAVWLGNPIVTYLSGTGYVEPLLALFGTAASFAFWRWRRDGGRSWLAVSGVLGGAAAATKYLGLFFVAVLAVGVVLARPPVEEARTRGRARLRDLLIFGAAALLVMAPWYGRILAQTGNPVFPFLSAIFGENEWTPVRFRTLLPPRWEGAPSALAGAAARLATLPWDVVARRHLVGGLPPLSPAYLVALPLIAAAGWRDRGLGRLVALAAGFVLLFPALPSDSRFLVIVLPLGSLALGVALARLLAGAPVGRRPWAVAAVALLLVLPGWLYAGHRLVLQGPPPVTAEERDEYLRRRLPLYPAVARVNELLRPGDSVYGLYAESMRDFVRGDFLGDWYGPQGYGELGPPGGGSGVLGDSLRSWGVDFLLVARQAPVPIAVDTERSRLDLVYRDAHALLYAVRPTEGR
jgi:4-amino-4-deoxy-L-arabinose transferase-like glycosyltransferase